LELEGDAAKRTLELVVRRMTLTCAQYVALNRVSRTIARLGGAMRGVEAKHVAEAAQYLSPAMPHYWEWTR
jgi:predicted ATPase with chaperone activity